MPDTSPESGMVGDGPDGASVDGAAGGRGSLDVPEWVSELRRLYVEPKTRATLRREGVIVAQKRRRGLPLPGVRGTRRGATDAPTAPGAGEEQSVGAMPVAPERRPAVHEPLGGTPEHAALPVVPMDVPAPEPADANPLGSEQSGSHPRSLAELAAMSEPHPPAARRDDLQSEPGPPANDGAAVLVSTGGDAATPNPAVASTPEPDAGLSRSTSSDVELTHAAPALILDEPQEGVRSEPVPVPGRPSTVPAVTLSWREAESFEIGVPGVGDAERAILVEPPSQLVAERRSRRRDPDGDDEVAPEPGAVEPPPAPAPVEVAPVTRASARAAQGEQSGRRRRMMVVALALVVLAIAAWYFLIRGDGEDKGAGSTASAGPSHTVVAGDVPG